MFKPFKVLNKLRNKMSKYQNAITFAEAGEFNQALEMRDGITIREESLKLLVIGEKGSFSKEIIDYALEMAKRMSYDILALNTASLSCDTFKLFSSHNKICDEFKLLSEKNIMSFREAAVEKGISFSHKVMFNETWKITNTGKRTIIWKIKTTDIYDGPFIIHYPKRLRGIKIKTIWDLYKILKTHYNILSTNNCYAMTIGKWK